MGFIQFLIGALVFISAITYIDAVVVIVKEAKKRKGADPFTAGLFSIFLTPLFGFLYLLLYNKD